MKPLVCLALCVGVSVTAAAETLDDLLNMPLDQLLRTPITAASRHPERVRDTPATVLVITAAHIRERGYRHLLDLLSDMPGFDVQRAVDSTRYNWLSVSGLNGSNRLLLFRDGVRVDSPTGDPVSVDHNFSLQGVTQVEIVLGPSAAVYGADAFGGVINIISQRDGRSLTATMGNGAYSQYAGHWTGEGGNGLRLRLNGQAHSDRRYEKVGDPARNAPMDAVNFAGQVVIPAAEREPYQALVESENLSAELDYRGLQLGGQYWQFQQQTSVGVRPQESLSGDGDIARTRMSNFYLRYSGDWSSRLSNRLLVDYHRYEILPQTRFSNIFSGFNPAYKYLLGNKRSLENQLHWQLDEGQELMLGAGREIFQAIPRTPDLPGAYQRSRSVYDQGSVYPNTDLAIHMYDLDYTNSFGFAHWSARWGERWSTSVGLRHDDSSDYGSSTNPRLGLVYQASEDTLVKALYGEGFRAPSPTAETYNTFGSFSGARDDEGRYLGTGFRTPNPDLRPEQIRAYELALLHQLNSRLNLSLRSFYYESSDLIDILPSPEPLQFIPGAWLSNATTRANLGDSTHQGVDVSLDGRQLLADGWRLSYWASYSYVDGHMTIGEQQRQLQFVAPHKLKLGATFHYRDSYYITARLLASDKVRGSLPRGAGRYAQAPGFAVVDLRLGLTDIGGERWQAALDIHNLFNTRYYHAVFDNSAGRGYGDVSQPERSLGLQLGYSWD